MSTHLDGVENFKAIETPLEKRQAAKDRGPVPGVVDVPKSGSKDSQLPGQNNPRERVIEDEVLLSPEAKAAQRAERESQAAAGIEPHAIPIGELYQKAVVDRLQDRLSGKRSDPEPTLLQRVYSNIRRPGSDAPQEDAPAPTPSSATTVAAE